MISVVIPTYNEEETIELCLKSLSNQSIPRDEYELIIVDGGSTDGTQEIAERYARVVRQESKGIPGARNDGVREASGEIIATTDADAIVPYRWLERIDSHFKRESVVGVIGPIDPIEPSPKSRIVFRVGEALFFLSYLMYLAPTGGNNCAFRKDPFLDVGGFREDLSYLDDLEMGSRLKRRGKIIYDPRLRVKVSARRMEEEGYTKTAFKWPKAWWTLLACGRIEPRSYSRKDLDNVEKLRI